ncbi:HNH endonuclease [Vagococcus lutrae]|uniref:HNH endonuclease n=1 Tax=Vagococcus lutrae TaxID=81947 RepID=UPI00288FF42E|nr:HNH endonuclease [Vagococcus lutrae]MDT2806988.1 HNH endonuclease [Vagococcus lutrae]
MKQSIDLSELLEKDLKTLLLFFFNINHDNNKEFWIEGSFKKSKYASIAYEKEELFQDTAKNLAMYYEIPFFSSGNTYKCTIKNDLGYSYNALIEQLKTKIIVKIMRAKSLASIDKEMALAIMILRGSPDFNLKYVAVDIKRSNETDIYLDSLFRILMSTDQLFKYLNWNFRDLQEQYITGKNQRNTQLRINLKWVSVNILDKIEQINKYKFNILATNQFLIGNYPVTDKMYTTFIKRIQFYRENISQQSLGQKEVEILRQELFGEGSIEPQRKDRIRLIVKNTTVDKCTACCSDYSIKDRSFIVPKDQRYYFEYHHVISFSRNRDELDVVENVVKLCPTCHRAMTPNRAYDKYQKKLIMNILNGRQDIFLFAKEYLNLESKKEIVTKIHTLLA